MEAQVIARTTKVVRGVDINMLCEGKKERNDIGSGEKFFYRKSGLQLQKRYF